MEFEWDEAKRQKTIFERNVDILYAAAIFEGVFITRLDDRFDYGEDRWISVGLVEGECFIVVHTERAGVTRLITAWKGGEHDRAEYQAGIDRRASENEGGGRASS